MFISILFVYLGLVLAAQKREPNKKQGDQQKSDLKPSSEDEQIQMLEEWDLHMKDFVPDDLISFTVEAKQLDTMIEDLQKPTKIRGAFFVHEMTSHDMSFYIKSPSGKLLYQKMKEDGVFGINTTEIGEHLFQFDNRKGKTNLVITFAIDVHNAKQDQIQSGDIDPLETDLIEINSHLQDIYIEHKFAQIKQVSGHTSMKNTNSRIMLFTLIETGVIIVVTLWQVWYIKGLFESKRLV